MPNMAAIVGVHDWGESSPGFDGWGPYSSPGAIHSAPEHPPDVDGGEPLDAISVTGGSVAGGGSPGSKLPKGYDEHKPETWNNAQLKGYLSRQGLPHSYNKPELVERVKSHMYGTHPASTTATPVLGSKGLGTVVKSIDSGCKSMTSFLDHSASWLQNIMVIGINQTPTEVKPGKVDAFAPTAISQSPVNDAWISTAFQFRTFMAYLLLQFGFFFFCDEGEDFAMDNLQKVFGSSTVGRFNKLTNVGALTVGMNDNKAYSFFTTMHTKFNDLLSKGLDEWGITPESPIREATTSLSELVKQFTYFKLWGSNIHAAMYMFGLLTVCFVIIFIILHKKSSWYASKVMMLSMLYCMCCMVLETNYAGCVPAEKTWDNLWGSYYYQYYARDDIIKRWPSANWVQYDKTGVSKCEDMSKYKMCIVAHNGKDYSDECLVDGLKVGTQEATNCRDSTTVSDNDQLHQKYIEFLKNQIGKKVIGGDDIGGAKELALSLKNISTLVNIPALQRVIDNKQYEKMVCRISGDVTYIQDEHQFTSIVWVNLTVDNAQYISDNCLSTSPEEKSVTASRHWNLPPVYLPFVQSLWLRNEERQRTWNDRLRSQNMGKCVSFGGRETFAHGWEKHLTTLNRDSESWNWWFCVANFIFTVFLMACMVCFSPMDFCWVMRDSWKRVFWHRSIIHVIFGMFAMAFVMYSYERGQDFNIVGWKLQAMFWACILGSFSYMIPFVILSFLEDDEKEEEEEEEGEVPIEKASSKKSARGKSPGRR